MILLGSNKKVVGIISNTNTVNTVYIGNDKKYHYESYDYIVDNGVITLTDAPYEENGGVITIL